MKLELAHSLVCAALLVAAACDSKSNEQAPQRVADRADASGPHDAGAELEKRDRADRTTDAGTKTDSAKDAGELPLRRDAGSPDSAHDAGVPRDGATTESSDGRDAAMPERDAEAPQRDAATPERDAETDDGGETDASLTGLSASITKVVVQGTLCAEGTHAASVSGDLAALTVTFSQAEVQTEAGESLDGTCEVALQLDVPEGFQFGRLGVRPSGYVLTADRGAAELELSYSFPASGASRTFTHALSGDHSYAFDDVAGDIWSPTCTGSHRNVQFNIVLRARTRDTAYLNINALDLDLAAVSGTPWRACELAR